MENTREELYVTAERTQALADFEQVISGQHYMGEWMVQRPKEHQTGGVPFLWKWEQTVALLKNACEVLELDKGARRSLIMVNPGIPSGTTLVLRTGLQMMRPHEVGTSHRHAINALRFVVKGNSQAWTVVNGEKLVMNDYDLILTPSYCWHHHENHSDQEVIWFDAVDARLCSALNSYFFEPHPDLRPGLIDEAESVKHRVGWTRPAWGEAVADAEVGLPIVYPWARVREQLEVLRNQGGSPCDGVIMEYVNPVTGGPALSTIDCHVQMLRAGERTACHRHNSGVVYFVVEGEGLTIAGDTELRWKQGDHFVVPSWAWHEHRNLSSHHEALLFSVSDAPVLKRLHLYREEVR